MLLRDNWAPEIMARRAYTRVSLGIPVNFLTADALARSDNAKREAASQLRDRGRWP